MTDLKEPLRGRYPWEEPIRVRIHAGDDRPSWAPLRWSPELAPQPFDWTRYRLMPLIVASARKRSPKNPYGYLDKRQARRQRRRMSRRPVTSLYAEPFTREVTR